MEHTFLNDLLGCISVSGYEEPAQQVVEEYMREYADVIQKDEMHNVICVLNPECKTRIMLSAHADEIGLMISNVTEEGMLQVVARGGIVPPTYLGRQVCINSQNGIVYGVVQAHRKAFDNKELGASDFVIDIGAENKEDALKYIAIGDPIVPDTQIRKMANGRFSARAFDDRIGVYIIMEAIKRAKQSGCKVGVYSASTVGEETTKTGAYWSSARIRPSLAIVVDVTYTSDCMGMNPAETGTVLLGKGPVLCNSPIVAKDLNEQMEKCAQKSGVLVQREAASGFSYTDGDKIHFSNEGVPIVLVSVPLRYMHMPAEVADEKDVEGCIKLITQFLVDYM